MSKLLHLDQNLCLHHTTSHINRWLTHTHTHTHQSTTIAESPKPSPTGIAHIASAKLTDNNNDTALCVRPRNPCDAPMEVTTNAGKAAEKAIAACDIVQDLGSRFQESSKKWEAELTKLMMNIGNNLRDSAPIEPP